MQTYSALFSLCSILLPSHQLYNYQYTKKYVTAIIQCTFLHYLEKLLINGTLECDSCFKPFCSLTIYLHISHLSQTPLH